VNFRGKRRAFTGEIRYQTPQRRGIEDRPREHVRTNLARLLQDRNRERLASAFLLELAQSQRSRHPGGTAAYDQNVDVESLAIGHG